MSSVAYIYVFTPGLAASDLFAYRSNIDIGLTSGGVKSGACINSKQSKCQSKYKTTATKRTMKTL